MTLENISQWIIALIILFGLYLISLQNYLLFHGIVELASIAIAFSIFIIVWNTRRTMTNTFFLIIGISFLFTGSIDLVHMLAYKGMGVFSGNSSDTPTQLWIAARYFQSITFLIAALLIGKSITKDRKYDVAIIFTACAVATGLLLASIFVWQNFPHCFIDGVGLTPFKIASEYVIAIILIITIGLLIKKRHSFDPSVWGFLIAAQVFLIAGELAFTSYISVYGFMNMLGHLFKIISFYFFYRAIVVVGITRPFDLLFFELKEKEEALKKSEARYSITLDAVNDGLWDWHIPSGNAFFSTHYYTMLGYTEGEFPATYDSWKTLVHPDDLAPVEEQLQRHIKTNTGFEIDLRMMTKYGGWKWVSTRGMVVDRDAAGTPVRMVGTLSDITERKKAEEALRQANKKLNLLSGITRHDINNQLTILMGFLSLLEKKQPDPSLNEYFQKVSTAVQRISSMIQFTKEYEKIGVHAPIWQDCRSLVDTAAKQAPLGNVTVKNNLPAGSEIFADPLVVKVFYNLMDNAVRYGGKITTIRFSALDRNGDRVIVCEDDGDGVVADEKEKIFDRGFGKNTGLGLALSREILDITGITIVETGEPGKGARFEMTVPKGMWK
jgi:PAS domain S-box-containing protein